MKIREGTPRDHLAPPVFFGLLGESHEWKNAEDPKEKIRKLALTVSFSRNLAGMTLALAALDVNFKKCCMRRGRYDGALQNHYNR